jgi:hypothetical protein
MGEGTVSKIMNSNGGTIMSFSIERVLNEIDQLNLVEQMQVVEHLVKQIIGQFKPYQTC